MKSRSLHLLGCLLPFLAIFLLPLLGLDSGVALLAFIVLMFGCHLFMMRGHEHNPSHDDAAESARRRDQP